MVSVNAKEYPTWANYYFIPVCCFVLFNVGDYLGRFLAGLIQCLGRWLTREKPFKLSEDDYLPYTFNRFQAWRFGLDGTFVDPETGEHRVLRDDLIRVLSRLDSHAGDLHAEGALQYLRREINGLGNDAAWLRQVEDEQHLLPEMVRRAAMRWHGR